MIITLDYNSEIPIYIQLRNQIIIGIGVGGLSYGEKLPTVRQLADDLSVNAMTVNKAYAILKNEGYISIDRRYGAKVSAMRQGHADYKQKLESELTLVISEAALNGISSEEFMHICSNIFTAVAVKNQHLPD
ncbi:DNA-binding transcriptional regulator YhcF (GntR family) [Paenibacillus castaneae]|uniref:GntR family transcriptional regulator n=1 Tax=Paenibacillus castaneae TaxID=474957 RepID=UPI000C9C6BD6|nr:GntR family transcriptional regulator [Paenibacillus castaneae]NIK80400.1 DNA-binding transcriptional regulator YhcF (GntR family) [Paenibacillus castaneae]